MKAEGSHYCGGGKVKKMADGGSSTNNIMGDLRSALNSGKDLDPGIVRQSSKSYVDKDPGIMAVQRDVKIPGIGTIPKPQTQTKNGLGLMKRGGKVKRGAKK